SRHPSRKVVHVADEAGAHGPISYLIVEFPGNKMTGDGLAALVDLVDRGLIRILDLTFVTRDADGTVSGIDIQDIDNDGELDLTIFEGVSSGLVDEGDREEAASAIEPGSSAGILIFENVWALPFVQGLRRGGAELVAAGYVPADALLASLDAA